MGIAKNFLDELAKHRLLVYFVTLWGAMSFLWQTYALVVYDFVLRARIDLYVVDLLFHFSELFAGALLVMVGVKLLNTDFLKGIKNEKLLVYFLILWAASFFFWGLWYLLDLGPDIFIHLENGIGLLGALAALFAGVVLGLFSWKLLSETEE